MGERRPRVDLRYAQRVVDVNVGVLGPRIPGMINVGKKKGDNLYLGDRCIFYM